jgi:hypothetical protein
VFRTPSAAKPRRHWVSWLFSVSWVFHRLWVFHLSEGGQNVTAEAGLTRTWNVGRYTVTLSLRKPTAGQIASVAAEWSPGLPERLTEAEVAQYVRGRNEALAELAAELGVRSAVIDV